MKKIFVIMAVLLVFFGCINLNGDPPVNTTPTNGTVQPPIQNTTPPKNVTIIIGAQQNVSVTTNQTVGNQTIIVPVIKGMNYSEQPDASMVIYFIPVGGVSPGLQGESIYIKKGNVDILIDAGPKENIASVIKRINQTNADDIDLIISTTADRRRFGGIPTVLDTFKVEEFWWTGKDFGNASYKSVINQVNSYDIETKVIGRGFSKTINGMKIDVLNPQTPEFKDVNNDAAVIRIADRDFSILFTSNIQTGARDAITSEQSSLIKNVKILDAPYYGLGAGTSGIQLFLTQVNPEHIIICGSSDDSQQQGGSRDAFKNLMATKKMNYTENYVNGTVALNTDGYNYSVMYLP